MTGIPGRLVRAGNKASVVGVDRLEATEAAGDPVGDGGNRCIDDDLDRIPPAVREMLRNGARPEYPEALFDTLVELTGVSSGRTSAVRGHISGVLITSVLVRLTRGAQAW
ncbi:hypothetical protein [Ornithinimicrobium sp.]|uniref:hypothetical protein n=1 Tax=Ornithinimicrobium sp. TaxID=1977084 RepID=UPI003D9B659B